MLDNHFLLFFLDDFHHGAMNHIIHAIGFTVLGYGLGRRNWWIVILSPFVMEMGHIFNYLTGTHQEVAIKIIPFQWTAWIIFVAIGYAATKFVSKNKISKQHDT